MIMKQSWKIVAPQCYDALTIATEVCLSKARRECKCQKTSNPKGGQLAGTNDGEKGRRVVSQVIVGVIQITLRISPPI